MLKIEIKIVEKKYDKEHNVSRIYVEAIVNGNKEHYSFTKFDGDANNVPDAFVFAQVLRLIQSDLKNPNL